MDTIVAILLTIFIYALIPLGIVIGIVFGIIGSQNKDELNKKRYKKIAWNMALYPIIIGVLILVIWGLLKVAS